MKKGSKMTEEQKIRNREIQKRAWANPELRKKHSLIHKGQIAWNKGKTGVYSSEQLKKMSEAHKGQVAWNKGKTLEALRGKKFSEETKKKLSESHKGQASYKVKASSHFTFNVLGVIIQDRYPWVEQTVTATGGYSYRTGE